MGPRAGRRRDHTQPRSEPPRRAGRRQNRYQPVTQAPRRRPQCRVSELQRTPTLNYSSGRNCLCGAVSQSIRIKYLYGAQIKGELMVLQGLRINRKTIYLNYAVIHS